MEQEEKISEGKRVEHRQLIMKYHFFIDMEQETSESDHEGLELVITGAEDGLSTQAMFLPS